MAYHSPRDPGFWDLEPAFLRPVQEACKPFDIDILHFVLGDPDDEHTPVAAMLRLPPGGVLARHAHPVVRFEVVVQGSLEAEGRTLRPGDVMVSPAGEEEMAAAEQVGDAPRGPQGRLAGRRSRLEAPPGATAPLCA